MANFTRTNLSLDHYTWDGDSNSNADLTGAPDSSTFNPQQGDEVLYILNSALSASAPITALHKGEALIRDELPDDKRAQLDVKKWLDEKI
ncbi:hypothetical protein B0H98_10885 [Vreelandella songnenensis]|uniref:Uncharacterized protein n=1 Tax=Vreelandella songnenensis TaxID=1176243 RepID=A0A2T0UZX8_9GAMM|nr:hypothetical protein [Halomonas songnenensis]PRY63490.1 hypothetical protein B0H98_10885 [Halomonas songnenensis]